MTAVSATPTQLNQTGGPFGSPLNGAPATITVIGTNFADPMTVRLIKNGAPVANTTINNAIVSNATQLSFLAPAIPDSELNNQNCLPAGGTTVTGSRNLYQLAEEIGGRLSSNFLRDANGKRPVYGGTNKFQEDPHWRDHILFYEYFHGDNGAGLGASHQTGCTGIIARIMHLFATTTAEQAFELGKGAAVRKLEEPVAA